MADPNEMPEHMIEDQAEATDQEMENMDTQTDSVTDGAHAYGSEVDQEMLEATEEQDNGEDPGDLVMEEIQHHGMADSRGGLTNNDNSFINEDTDEQLNDADVAVILQQALEPTNDTGVHADALGIEQPGQYLPPTLMDHHTHNEQTFHEQDSESLFVPEYNTSVPTVPSSSKSAAPMLRSKGPSAAPKIPSNRPSAAPKKGAPTSIFDRVRAMQKRVDDRRKAAAQLPYPINHNVDNEAYLESVTTSIGRGNAPLPEVAEETMEDRQAVAEFQKKKRHYDNLKRQNGGTLGFREDIEWMKIRGAEDARRKKRARDAMKDRAEAEEANAEEPSSSRVSFDNDRNEEFDDLFGLDNVRPPKRLRQTYRKSMKQPSMQQAELESMQVALQAQEDAPRKMKKKQPADDDDDDDDDDSTVAGPSNRGRGNKAAAGRSAKSKGKVAKTTRASGSGRKTAKSKREADAALRQATSLFNSNIFDQQADRSAAEQPTFRSRNKKDALKELIASVPIDHEKKAKSDMNVLLTATRDFDGHGAVKPKDGLWLVKGMSTPLKAYQILGSAFMRRRENDGAEPRGGLMADQMGLGKTLMMLANIVNAQPPKGSRDLRTTLLVASPSLLTQWKSEIEQHTNMKLKIMRYGPGNRIDSNDPAEVFGSHDIVLTTYQEVMRSYPKNEPPIECQTVQQKMEWWQNMYENHRGVLHRTMFLRVVLDEAQAIKNHTGRTSIACRALMAKHKWALSGTPILNSLTELYAYFKFLGVPHTGSFKIFKHNYCDTADAENVERLLMRLAQFMIRRTHADQMFGAPILKLPHASQATLWCDFNPVERCIYDIVRSRFAKRINVWAKSGELDSSYSNALVMLLRLRQLTAHVLMLQFVMKELLEREDIERIQEVVNKESGRSQTQGGRTILAVRKQLEKLAEDEKKKRAANDKARAAAKAAGKPVPNDIDIDLDDDPMDEDLYEDESVESQQGSKRMQSGGAFGKDFNFKPYLNSLREGENWDKVKKKAKCYECGKQPNNPFISSCGHLICAEPCLADVSLQAAEDDKEYSACKACGITPTYHHPCEPEEEAFGDIVAHGTRSNSKKKKADQEKRRERDDIRTDWLVSAGDDVLPSAKTIAVKSQILNWKKENPKVKIIIYTQFIAMIRILARICQKEGWQVEQYHGNMSLSARDKAIASFAENPDTHIMLASLRCGGLGLNLTMASKVIMIDPWWNSAAEQQAFCRVFRIGQKDPTFMSRMCVSNTVDERLIQMQERKKVEIDSVMEDDGSKLKKMEIRDLMRLFGNLQEDNDGKPFIMVDNPDPMGGFRADRDDEGYADEF